VLKIELDDNSMTRQPDRFLAPARRALSEEKTEAAWLEGGLLTLEQIATEARLVG